MAGVLLEPVQVDARSGVLTLFGPKSTEQRSVCFVVIDKPLILVAFNLQAGQKATLYNVAQVGNTTRESIFSYNGNTIELTASKPTAVVALTGTYRLIMGSMVGMAVVKAYPQEADNKPIAPLRSDIVNSIGLISGVPSNTIQVTGKAITLVAYELGVGQQVDVYFTSNGADAYYATITNTNTSLELQYTGEYRLVSNVDCLVTARPNYVFFENPYVIQGPKGDKGDDATGGGIQYIFNTPATVWVINHNLGRYVNVQAFTLGGFYMVANVVNISLNQVQIEFDALTTGYAIVN